MSEVIVIESSIFLLLLFFINLKSTADHVTQYESSKHRHTCVHSTTSSFLNDNSLWLSTVSVIILRRWSSSTISIILRWILRLSIGRLILRLPIKLTTIGRRWLAICDLSMTLAFYYWIGLCYR